MRIVIARCQVDYAGRLTAHLSLATRLIMVKSDGSVLVHSDGGSYKPLNWMSPPCTLTIGEPDDDARAEGVTEVWTVQNSKSDDRLVVGFHEILHDTSHDLGVDPGLVKDGVEAHLQRLLAENVHMFGAGWRLVRREYPTPIGPVDLLCRSESGVTVTVEVDGHDDAGPAVAVEVELDGDAGTGDGRADLTDLTDVAGASSRRASARHLAVEVKRKANIDAVEQLTRYLELLNRDPLLAPVRGMLAAQSVVPQARVLAEDRGIEVLVVDYDALRGVDDPTTRLF